MYGGRNGTSESWSLQFPPTESPVVSSSNAETAISFGGPLTLIVFGGEAVEATAYFLKKGEETEQNPCLARWKAAEYRKIVSGAKQIIGFYGSCSKQERNSRILMKQLASNGTRWAHLYSHDKIFGIAKSQTDVEEVFSRTEQDDEGFFIINFQ